MKDKPKHKPIVKRFLMNKKDEMDELQSEHIIVVNTNRIRYKSTVHAYAEQKLELLIINWF